MTGVSVTTIETDLGYLMTTDPRKRRLVACLATVVFLIAAVGCNVLTAEFELTTWLGLTVTAGTWAAGVVFIARDVVHDAAGRVAVVALVAVGAVLSAWLAGPQLALASAATFAVAELADLLVYVPLRRRGWLRAIVASQVVGAVVDTVLFLKLAEFPLWQAGPSQLLVKLATLVPLLGVVVARAVLRDRVRLGGV